MTKPLSHYHQSGSSEDKILGRKLLREGKCATLVVAGGMGSRLGFEHPKGCFPISPIGKKSFFELLAERTKKMEGLVGRILPLAIMTSPDNDRETQRFFKEHHFFGLSEEQLSFFQQETLPILDLQGKPLYKSEGELLTGPNGNGGALRLLASAPFYQSWKASGVEMVHFILIDNALAFPFDEEVFGFHHRMQVEVTVKAVRRKHLQESVGLLVEENGKTSVIEYSEFPPEEREGYHLANISLFCFSTSFIDRMKEVKLPLHAAHKAVKYYAEGKMHAPDGPNAIKREEFIFDVLPYSRKTEVLVYPREEIFAPLKSLKGENGVEEVQRALLEFEMNQK